jgi:hypothetical protein
VSQRAAVGRACVVRACGGRLASRASKGQPPASSASALQGIAVLQSAAAKLLVGRERTLTPMDADALQARRGRNGGGSCACVDYGNRTQSGLLF